MRVRHLVQKPSGCYYQATPAMKRAGIVSESLGKDLTKAIKRAEFLNHQWDRIRRSEEPRTLAPIPGTFNALLAKVEASAEYRDKQPRTREELDYAVKIIRPVFGPQPARSDHSRPLPPLL